MLTLQTPFRLAHCRCTVFNLPTGFAPETIPPVKTLQNAYASFSRHLTYNKEANQLTSISMLALKSHVIPAADYGKLFYFFKEVSEWEQENLVLVQQ